MSIHRSAILAIVTMTVLSACTTPVPKQSAVTQEAPAAAEAKLDPAAGQTPAVKPAATPQPSGAGAQLQQLIQERAVTELRTVYNGAYGASLLFDTHSLEYYAALFYNKDFWKVTKTLDSKRAEQRYEQYARKSASLAEADLRRIRLQASYAHTEAQLNERSAELSALQADLDAQREQARQIAAQQTVAHQEAARLSKQQADAQKQLKALKDSIRRLEAQQAKLR
ncbi:DUF2968 domain-containing protein [Castellaniella sp.]|uniref:DUF2968 domain-containing protein n=1 Tax=Castellaniella sp. TaxID=1955812 RepID=UPI003C7763D0